ncbi:hypothetical protein K523DRAFT_134787 [Schizophyllum commune Tattone D]|nr:hypothetical protein K523DRAFT_134787 [Schizophyllum commune Tattone D]
MPLWTSKSPLYTSLNDPPPSRRPITMALSRLATSICDVSVASCTSTRCAFCGASQPVVTITTCIRPSLRTAAKIPIHPQPLPICRQRTGASVLTFAHITDGVCLAIPSLLVLRRSTVYQLFPPILRIPAPLADRVLLDSDDIDRYAYVD